MEEFDEFDFYEIKQWIQEYGITKESLIQSFSYNPHPFATTFIEANLETLPSRFFVRNCHHLLCQNNINNQKLQLFLRLKEKNLQEIIPYDIYTELLLYFHLEYNNDLKGDLKKRLQERKAEGTWKFGKLIQHICLTEPMETIKELKYINLDWHALALNHHPCVMDFLRQNKRNLMWGVLATNPSDVAVDLLFESEIDWFSASSNTNDRITVHFPEMRENVSVVQLCTNPSDFVVNWLLEDPLMYERIIWSRFCTNPNDHAVEHIYNISLLNPTDKRIEWAHLCLNQNKLVFRILRNNPSKIWWEIFLKNPICLEYNYEMMRRRASIFRDELLSVVFSPEKVMRMIHLSRENADLDDFEIVSNLDF
jgi:hypothetical protein